MATARDNCESGMEESLLLSCSESEYKLFGEESESSIDKEAAAGEILPYRFEPYAEDARQDSPVRPDDAEDREQSPGRFMPIDVGRLENTEWCRCGHCHNLPIVEERVCCLEFPQVVKRMEECPISIGCITEHPGFKSVCLDVWSLQVAYLANAAEYGHMDDQNVPRRYRYTGYRQLVCWCCGRLGRHVRVPLPACAVTTIRAEFPEADYEGFHFPRLNL